jgi:hypothetical protein
MVNRFLRSLMGLSAAFVVGLVISGIWGIIPQTLAQSVSPVPLSPTNLPLAPGIPSPAPQQAVPIPTPQPTPNLLAQGTQIQLNGKTFPVAWRQWQRGTETRTGISDTGAVALLGVVLLNTDQPNRQPAQWFTRDEKVSVVLDAQFVSPYRYLDVSDLLKQAGATAQINGSLLAINIPPVQLENVRIGKQIWGQRLVLDLSRPVFWQVSQNKTEGVVTMLGNASPELVARFAQNGAPGANNNANDGNEDDLGRGAIAGERSAQGSAPGSTAGSQVRLEQSANQLKIKLDLPPAQGLQIFSLSNPPRLVINIRPDYKQAKDIAWYPGLNWRQQLVSLGSSQFPVTIVEIDPKSPNISLKPIVSNPKSQIGTAPIVATAIASQASIAINGGFFNRNNQLPLGAIRQEDRWLSGPILNRGAIAWDNKGKFSSDRLNLQETVTSAGGKKLTVAYLNTGLVQSGLARYTADWGARYSPLSDDETIIAVENNQVSSQQPGGKAGSNSFIIPNNGYLLIIRKNAIPAASLSVGTALTLESKTFPPEYDTLPNILGAGPLLIKNRQIVLNGDIEKFSAAFLQQQASRSAIGRTGKGTIILVAVHHRLNGNGPTLQEMANILQELGAIDALNLDGGSSTSLSLGGQLIDRSPVTAGRVHNGIGVFVAP